MNVRVVFCDFFVFISDNFLKELKDVENPKAGIRMQS
jgi:hypothetical protein